MEELLPKDWKRVKVGEYVISVKGKKPEIVFKSKNQKICNPLYKYKGF